MKIPLFVSCSKVFDVSPAALFGAVVLGWLAVGSLMGIDTSSLWSLKSVTILIPDLCGALGYSVGSLFLFWHSFWLADKQQPAVA